KPVRCFARLRHPRVVLAITAASLLATVLVLLRYVDSPDPADWTTYHHDNRRAGIAPRLAPLGTLARSWDTKLDGAVYGQPLVVGYLVFAATENDTVYALDAATGRVRWSTHVGTPVPLAQLPCGNIDPLGITGTMVYDPATGLLFALAETTGGRHV